jgi:hypothetical protein
MSNDIFLIPQDGAPGAKGDTGDTGATGATGPAGPNEVTASTSSTLVGILQADGTNVGTVTIGTGLSYSGGTLSVSGGSGIGGSTGATDNAILRADGTGGATLQNSGVTVSDNSEVLIVSGAATAIPLAIKAAASQTGNLQEWQNSAGTILARVDNAGTIRTTAGTALQTAGFVIISNGSVQSPIINVGGWWTGTQTANGGINLGSGHRIAWGSATSNSTTSGVSGDAGLSRHAAGAIEINNGTAGTFRDLIIRNLRMASPSMIPETASATGSEGQIAWDADYIYICTATDTWKRVAIATW